MRFGKKLALEQNTDKTGAPYISHGILKTQIERFARELKQTCVSRHVVLMDQTFFKILHDDLQQILNYIHQADIQLGNGLALLQQRSIELGILFEQKTLERLAETLQYTGDVDSRKMCRHILGMKLDANGNPKFFAIEQVMKDFDTWLSDLSKHVKYIEINAAGFRKLLKQREKQLSKQLREDLENDACCPLSDFTWVQIVTNKIRLLLIAAEKMWEAFNYLIRIMKLQITLQEVPRLGSESYTCLMISRDVQSKIYPIQWMDVRDPRPPKCR